MKPKKKKWAKNFFNYCGITYFDLNKLLEAKQEDDFKEFRNTIISDSLHESIPNFTGQSSDRDCKFIWPNKLLPVQQIINKFHRLTNVFITYK